MQVHLLDSQRKAGVSKVQVVVNGELPVFGSCFVHNLIKTRVDNVNLTGTLQVLHVGRVLRDLVTHLFKYFKVLFLGVFLGHTAWGNMIQVLKPFKVGASHTATIGKHVRYGDDSSREQMLLGEEGSGAVSTFNNNFALKLVSVVSVDSLFLCGRNEDVTFEFHKLRGVQVGFGCCSVETLKGATLVHPGLD